MNFDTAVIGGGITGQLIATALAKQGKKVVLLEKTLAALTSPSARNHGIVHSGALFVEKHPEVVADCQAAQSEFLRDFSHCQLDAKPSLYLVPHDRAEVFHEAVRSHGLPVVHLSPHSNVPFLQSWVLKQYAAFQLKELVLDKVSVLQTLWQRAVDAGVEVFPSTQVTRVEKTNDGYKVVLPFTSFSARTVILAAGAGTASLLRGLGSTQVPNLSTRVATMLVVPAPALTQPFLTLTPQSPVVVPHQHGCLVSLYGATQPTWQPAHAEDINPSLVQEVVSNFKRFIAPGVVDWENYRAYHSTKTDYLGNFAENGVSPHYAVINHAADNNLTNLWTVIPGKWTLAYAATKKLLEYLV